MILIFVFAIMEVWVTFKETIFLFGTVESLQFMSEFTVFLFELLKLHQSLLNNSFELFLFIQSLNKFDILWIFIIVLVFNIKVLHDLFELLLIIFVIH